MRQLLLTLVLLLGASCANEAPPPVGDIVVSFSSDTAWVWQNGSNNFKVTLSATDDATAGFEVTYYDPVTKSTRTATLARGTHPLLINPTPIFLTQTSLYQIPLEVSRGGRTVTTSFVTGVGGTKLELVAGTTPGVLQKGDLYEFKFTSHPGATLRWLDPFTGGMRSTNPAMSDGILRFGDAIGLSTPKGDYAFEFYATRPNFGNSDTLEYTVRVQ